MKAREIMSKDHQPKIFPSMIIAIGHVPNILREVGSMSYPYLSPVSKRTMMSVHIY